ncbi:hypothetical protein KKB18_08995 [bacterium]|nr:hypothetical protein [bacterium]
MRVSDTRTMRTFLYNYNRVKEELDRANQEIGSGKKLLKPSDDPVNAARTIILRSNYSKIEQFKKNISDNIAYSKQVQLALSETEKIITNIKQETLKALNGTLNEEERMTIAQNIMGYLDDLEDISNSKYMGKALFSGFETDKKAFSSNDSSIVNIDPLPTMVLQTNTVTTFKDLPELDRGIYNINIDSDGTDVTISMTDEAGNVVQLDNNGIDDYGSQNGNIMNDSMTVVNAAGKTINIGRGIEIELDSALTSGTQTLKIEYSEDQTAVYHGDVGELKSRISEDTIIPLSVPGYKIFQNDRVIGSKFIDNKNGIAIPDGNGNVSFTIGDGTTISSTIILTQGSTYTQDQLLTILDNAGLYIGEGDMTANTVNVKASFDENGHLVLSYTNEAKADKIIIREYTNSENTLENTLGIKTGTYKGQDLFDVISDISEMIESDTFHAKIAYPTTWTGNSTSEVTIGGAYTGNSDNTYLFTVDGIGGTVGATSGLTIIVTDQSSGAVVATLDVGDTYESGSEIEVTDGIHIKLSPYELAANDTFTLSVRTDRDRLDRLESSLDQVLEQSVKVGYNLNRLEASSTRFENLTLTLTEELSRIEDADVAEVYTHYQADETVYNSLLQLYSKFQNLSLLNFI